MDFGNFRRQLKVHEFDINTEHSLLPVFDKRYANEGFLFKETVCGNGRVSYLTNFS